ncbi:hypothetical protein X777_12466, partial [Ooceraea biroi]
FQFAKNAKTRRLICKQCEENAVSADICERWFRRNKSKHFEDKSRLGRSVEMETGFGDVIESMKEDTV